MPNPAPPIARFPREHSRIETIAEGVPLAAAQPAQSRNRTSAGAVADQYRYERKYHALDQEIAALEMLIKLHPAHFRETYPPRFVNNVYFDTVSLSSYRTHVEGASRRLKARVRWYGDEDAPAGKAIMEIKSRRGLVGTKKSIALGPMDNPRSIQASILRDRLRSIPGGQRWIECLAGWTPAIFNRYHRRYYASVDGGFRLTLDTRLAFRAVEVRPLAARREFLERRLSVIELKYAVDRDAVADRAVELPFRLERMSKYVYGVQRLVGLPTPGLYH